MGLGICNFASNVGKPVTAASRPAAAGTRGTKAALAQRGVAEAPPKVVGKKLPGEPLTPIGAGKPRSTPGNPGSLISLEV